MFLLSPRLRGDEREKLLPHLVRRRAHGLDDVLITGATAQVRRQHVEQIVVADVGLALEHADRQHQKARRAKAALQAVMIHEGLLHDVQRLAIGEPFDGADLSAFGLYGEVLPNQNGAPVALTVVDSGDAIAAAMSRLVTDPRIASITATSVNASDVAALETSALVTPSSW